MRRTSLTAATLLTIGALAAGCGGGGSVADDPEQGLQDAVEATGEWAGASLTFRLDSDADSLLAASEGDLDAEGADAILNSFVRTEWLTEGEGEDATSQGTVLVEVDGIAAFEMRRIEPETAYVRTELNALLERFSEQLEVDRAMIDQQVEQAQTQLDLPWLSDAMDGAWLELRGVDQFSEMVGNMAGTQGQAIDAEAAREANRRIAQAARQTLEDAEVTFVGDEDPGEHLRAAVTLREAAELYRTALTEYAQIVPEDAAGDMQAQLDEADRQIEEALEENGDAIIPVDLWVADGALTQIGFDVVAFAQENPELTAEDPMPEGVERMVVLVEMAEFTGPVEAPSDAIEVGLLELFSKFAGMSQLGGMGGDA
jgi:hypothetical protein